MDKAYCHFKMREIIDTTLSCLSVPELLYGKLTSDMLITLRQDILALKLDREECYTHWREIIMEMHRNLMTLINELDMILMIIGKRHWNTCNREDQIDG